MTRIDDLALRMEREIARNDQFLNGFPEFKPRSDRSKRLRRKVERNNE